ncbi:MAG: trypsin-like peptidase domain-containing protein [Candidatus Promineifilaceae bacterium]|nr:trypsin-like peptidase domain-containing protein [Candidatus Promineifilaceae bacterium]
MDRRGYFIVAGAGCLVLVALVVVAGFLVTSLLPFEVSGGASAESSVVVSEATLDPAVQVTQQAIPTLTPAPESGAEAEAGDALPGMETLSSALLGDLYQRINPGVVNVQVFTAEGLGGQGAGSGFVLDQEGHIVTNNHVVAGSQRVTVVFYNGLEAQAEIVGTDDDSDLAVLKVEQMPEGVQVLDLADSDAVRPGDWVLAIGNPFRLGGSLTIGIVSAVGRIIPSGVTPFSIPQAIQTDAAINPGNSGGPLLNLNGEVVGVNAQIRTGGTGRANSGVGFAIPANVVRQVAPVLIEQGVYRWPWLGVQQPAPVNLLIMQANELETQSGVYIHRVTPDGPASQAGLQGSTGSRVVDGIDVPTGGDVILAADGQSIDDLSELLVEIAFRSPGDEMVLTVLRDGERIELTVVLEARPENF